ncbi:LCP family protein [Pullulanibacillus sp. KACC 23026]|uniref:LCP family protein n=1 Tax=Pullulanibacillus sp. KACC 23026 TaxID=3028315 RepID=UPI0023AF8013|nr:LCP family protein [Pullulanibacillus sp. KACC 23026]WEG13293.1 LCP family protein [Pullulanibacillus sp. KACC 23026]
MERTARRQKRKKKWPKVILIIVIAIIVVGGGAAAYFYNSLKPTNHFKNVTSITSDTSGTESKSVPNSSSDTPKQEQGTMNILMLGSDERSNNSAGHSDTIILMHVNFNTNKISAVSIPRDTRVHLAGYGYTKLTSVQYIVQATKGQKAGMVAAAQSVSELTGVPINYYVETNYDGLQAMVNALGGNLTVDVPFDVKITHPWYKEDIGMNIKAGTQTLTSRQVFEMVHERYSLPHSDYSRQVLEEKVLLAIAKEGLKPANITNLPNLIQKKSDFLIGTNMSNSDLLSFGMAMKDIDTKQIKYYQIKGASKTMYDDILKANNSEVILDQSSLNAAMSHFK